MIFLSGQKASGKTTVAKIFEKENFLVLDQGPFWKNAIRDCRPEGMKAGEFFKYIKDITGDNNWDDNVIVGVINNLYRFNKENYKDIVIAGYRSYDGILYLTKQLEGKIYPEKPTKVIYLTSEINTVLARFNKRENSNIEIEQLEAMYQSEINRGVLKIQELADFTINTTNTEIRELDSIVNEIIYNQLPYSRDLSHENHESEIVDGNIEKKYTFGKLNNYDYVYALKDINDAVDFVRKNIGDSETIKSVLENCREISLQKIDNEGCIGPGGKERF